MRSVANAGVAAAADTGTGSPREREVVRLVLQGTNRQIVGELSRSPSTVGAQLKSAMREYGVSTRTALAVIVSRADGD
ncbi:response regulator transcription factor [Streptomyces sp. OV198]|uniref:response regulator transcription factor n=1 Tax=Streptomyces sp. OV198 TaxID=1882787 RepID=UPI00359C4634